MVQLQRLDFSYNWNNKLDCLAFTTIRISAKYKVGDRYDIHLKDERIGIAKIVAVKEILAANITEPMAYMDTGYCKAEVINILNKMYGKTYDLKHKPIYHITLVFEKRLRYVNSEHFGTEPSPPKPVAETLAEKKELVSQ